ncbi:hypothetical protein BCR39DRAFT_560767 [Naematelia encephala]|uniref:Uncharacterized protein n=1 Tax=Naematelia encephala TaxID=71784 RepID=A0A1Y2AVY1_9TREE|nr:hypothetical protein BCR39DRAFT_560767 [Naematelia encephala]
MSALSSSESESRPVPVTLPLDIIAQLSRHLCDDDDVKSLSALSLTSRDVYQVANPLLWRKVTISSDRIVPALETLDFFPDWDMDNYEKAREELKAQASKGLPLMDAALDSLSQVSKGQLHPVDSSTSVRMMYNLGHIRTLVLSHQPADEAIAGFYRFTRAIALLRNQHALLSIHIDRLIILPDLITEMQEDEWNDRPVARFFLRCLKILTSPREACIHYPIFDTPPKRKYKSLGHHMRQLIPWESEHQFSAMFWTSPAFLTRFTRVEAHGLVWQNHWPSVRGAANRYTFARYPMVQPPPSWNPAPHGELAGSHYGPPIHMHHRAYSIISALHKCAYDIKQDRGNPDGTGTWEFVDSNAMLRTRRSYTDTQLEETTRAMVNEEMARLGVGETERAKVQKLVTFSTRDQAIKVGGSCCGVCGTVVLED